MLRFRNWLRCETVNMGGSNSFGDPDLDLLAQAAALSEHRSRKPNFPAQDPRLEDVQATDFDAMWIALMSLDGNVAEKIEAHGLAKGSPTAQMAIMVEKVRKGRLDAGEYTAPLGVPDDKKAALASALGTAGGAAYTHGGFVICSEYGGKLQQKIGFVIVSQPFCMDNGVVDGVGVLKEKFPHVTFVPYNKAVAYVNAIAKRGAATPAGQQAQPGAQAGAQPQQWSLTGYIKGLGVDPAAIRTLDRGDGWLVTVSKSVSGKPAMVAVKLSKDGKRMEVGLAGQPGQIVDTRQGEALLKRLLA